MAFDLFIIFLFAIIFGLLFFIEDFSTKLKIRLNISFIAGVSIAYFFIVLLPEISERLPELPLHLKIFEFLFILLGFIIIHVSEKLILQKVESKSQKRVRKLIKMEKNLEIVERNIEDIITLELTQEEKLDEYALRDLGKTLTELQDQSKEIRSEIEEKKLKIKMHIQKDLNEIRYFTDFIYHFIVGLLIVALLIIEFLSGILFFIFAYFRVIVTSGSESSLEVYSDIGIEIKFEESRSIRFLLSSAALIGIAFGILLELFLPVNLEIIYILYSFISGVILYTIVREVIPEKEKGNPLYFLIGAVGFILIIYLVRIFTTLIQI
jgi:zinc transporter ZupT